ncbi:MAG: hypothetical protein M3292_02535 [Actinomycetota bacterium]|nr:hypothetical protein [Actinomycetota bacterium]
MDDLVDVVDVDLAGAVARDRLLDVVDELAELGLVLGPDTLTRGSPLRLRRVVHRRPAYDPTSLSVYSRGTNLARRRVSSCEWILGARRGRQIAAAVSVLS